MNEDQRLERHEARAAAKKWEAASAACCISFLLLQLGSGWLSKCLSPLVGVGADSLRVLFAFLVLIWGGVGIFCGVRADEMRHIATGQKPWREHKRDMEAEAARAKAFLNIER